MASTTSDPTPTAGKQTPPEMIAQRRPHDTQFLATSEPTWKPGIHPPLSAPLPRSRLLPRTRPARHISPGPRHISFSWHNGCVVTTYAHHPKRRHNHVAESLINQPDA